MNSSEFIEIKLSDANTISAAINGNSIECLVDTGASINLIDHDWLYSNLPSVRDMIQKPRIQIARVANGSNLEITGFLVLFISVNGVLFQVPLSIARNLSSNMILGRMFLKKTLRNY